MQDIRSRPTQIKYQPNKRRNFHDMNVSSKSPETTKPKGSPKKGILIPIISIIVIISLLSTAIFVLFESENDHKNESPNHKNYYNSEFRKELDDSIILGADFLVRMQNPNGSYKYKYYPESDSYSTENNILRHTGVVYSLLQVYEYTQDPKYLESAENGIDFLMRHIQYIDYDKAYVFFNNKAKLGGAALAVIALAKLETLEHRNEYIDIITELINFILYMQEDSGKFTSFYIYNGEYKSPSDSNIYPGEAVLALIRAYGVLNDPDYLDAMDKAYEYYVVQFAQDPRTDFTSWTTTAYVELYNIVPKREYVDFVFEMEDWLVAQQYVDNLEDPRFLGGFGPDIPHVGTSGRSEGVADAYLLAKKIKDEKRTEDYENSIILAVKFLLQLQYTKEITAIHPNPTEALGAFFHHFGSNTARIDYTQHCISIMIKVLTYIPPENGEV